MGRVRIITRHQGNVEKMEYGYFVNYLPVSDRTYERMFGCEPEHPNFCVATGEFGDGCEECQWLIGDRCLNVKLLSDRVVRVIVAAHGQELSEDEMIIDATKHQPVQCDQHPEEGCIVCYPGCREDHHEE